MTVLPFSSMGLVVAVAGLWAVRTAAQTNGLQEFKAESAREYLRTLAEVVRTQVGTNAEGLFCLARVHSQLGEKGEAERLGRQALDRAPGRSDIALFLADILIRQDRMEAAAACLREAVKRDPKCKGGYRQLGMVLERMGDRDGAQQAFASAVRDWPGDAGAWLLRGKSFLDQEKLKEAVADLEKACALDPDLANAYYPLFQAQTKLGNREAAQAALKKFQELKKEEKTGIGVLADKPGDDEGDLRAFTAGVHLATAAILLSESNMLGAEEHLRRAVSVAPRNADAHELLGRLCVQTGRLSEARTNLEEVVQLRPAGAGDRVNLGTLLLQLGDYAAGIAELRRALELDPKRPEALHNLARYYLTSGKELPEGLALARRLVEVDGSAANYDLLGWAWYANGKTNEALAATTEAVKREPGNSVYSARLRRLQQLTGSKQ